MTAVEKTQAISDLCEAGLPSLLATATLDNFDRCRNKSPKQADDKELCVYIITDDDDVNTDSFGVIIQAQIYGDDQVQEYHSVIKPFLIENLTGAVVEMTQRMSLKSDIYPMEIMGSSGYILYSIIFETPLDGCDDDS